MPSRLHESEPLPTAAEPTRPRPGVARPAAPADELFLPDFCAIPMVFSVVVIGELLAFLLVLGGGFPQSVGELWSELALTSLFVQWVGLSSAGLLCIVRRWLRRLSNPLAGGLGYGSILLLTAAATAFGHWLGYWFGTGHGGDAAPAVTGDPLPWFAQSAGAFGPALAEALMRNLTIAAIVAAVALRYLFVQHQWRAQIEREARARFQALQSRIRPHFLFNSMNTIAAFTRSKPELAEQVVEDLAELFRVSLADARVPVRLEREVALGRQYLRIEGLRLGARLDTHWDVDALPGHALLPALTLQPLLENAVYHGIEPAAGGGSIRIEGQVEPGARAGDPGGVVLDLVNTVDRDAPAPPAGNRMALDNVRERVLAFFAHGASLEATPGSGEFRVRLRFPVVTSDVGP